MQRRLALGHFSLAVFGCDQLHEVAVVRLTGNDCWLFTFTRLHQQFERRHLIRAAGLGRLMTSLAMCLKDGSHLSVEADLVGVGIWGIFSQDRNGDTQRERRDEQMRESSVHGVTL